MSRSLAVDRGKPSSGWSASFLQKLTVSPQGFAFWVPGLFAHLKDEWDIFLKIL